MSTSPIPQDKKYTGREIETIQKWRRLNMKEYFSHHPQATPARSYLMTACFASTMIPVDFNILEVQKKLRIELPSGFDLTQAKMGLRILAAIGEASDAVAPLKAASLVALEIVDLVESARDNQDRCKILAEDIFKLMESVSIEEFHIRPGDELAKVHLKEFVDNLNAIKSLISQMIDRQKARRFGYAQADAKVLDQCEETVKKSRDFFMLHLALEQRRKVQSIEEKIDFLVQHHIKLPQSLSWAGSISSQYQQPATPTSSGTLKDPPRTFLPSPPLRSQPTSPRSAQTPGSTPSLASRSGALRAGTGLLTQSPVPVSSTPSYSASPLTPSRLDGRDTTGNATPGTVNAGRNRHDRSASGSTISPRGTTDSTNVLSIDVPSLNKSKQGSRN